MFSKAEFIAAHQSNVVNPAMLASAVLAIYSKRHAHRLLVEIDRASNNRRLELVYNAMTWSTVAEVPFNLDSMFWFPEPPTPQANPVAAQANFDDLPEYNTVSDIRDLQDEAVVVVSALVPKQAPPKPKVKLPKQHRFSTGSAFAQLLVDAGLAEPA